MKWRIWKRPPEWKKISLYAVVILVSLFVCEFAFAARKAKGVTCVKDFIITYNYRVVPYIAIPVIMVLLISYFRRMYDDNRMVRYVNIRNFYISVIGGGIGRIVLYVVIMTVWMFIGGVVSTHGIIDNWQSKNAMAKRVYGAYLTDTKFITVFSGIFITLILMMIIKMEMLMIIHRYIHSWIAGYFICIVLNLYMLVEQGNARVLKTFITYRVYQNGWRYSSLVYMAVIVAVLLMVILLMGKCDSLRRNR